MAGGHHFLALPVLDLGGRPQRGGPCGRRGGGTGGGCATHRRRRRGLAAAVSTGPLGNLKITDGDDALNDIQEK